MAQVLSPPTEFGRNKSFYEFPPDRYVPSSSLANLYTSPPTTPENKSRKGLGGGGYFALSPPKCGRPPSHPDPKSQSLCSFSYLREKGRGPERRKGGVTNSRLPRFVPICSDFPVFFRVVPISDCVPCFLGCPDCSDLLQFLLL